MDRVPVTPSLWSSLLVGEGGGVVEDYDQCFLEFDSGGDLGVCYVIPIAVVQKKLLVAVPSGAWAKSAQDRYLPKTALTKPVLVEVEGVALEDAEDRGETKLCKVWVGFLRGDLFGEAEEPGALDFLDEGGGRVAPLASPLVELANDHFAFFSAAEEEPDGGGELEVRMKKMEETLEVVRASLVGLGGTSGGAKVGAAPKARPVFPGLDPGVVSSALQAGIGADQLEKLSGLLAKPNRMEENGTRRKESIRDVLSESEDEELVAACEEEEKGKDQGPVEKAVVQLTRLVSDLAKQKSKKTGLEGLLERVDAGGGESSSGLGSSSRSKAGAYKKLKAALTSHPDWLSRSIESLMEEDFNLVKSKPGAGQMATSSRAWLEHRSRLMHYPSTIRFGWAIAGIHDALKEGRTEEARARCCLTLAAIDQSSIDNGSWTLAQEVLLEQAAPYGSFVGRRSPELSEHPSSRLLDERLLEVVVWRIKERDQYIESRKRLGAAEKAMANPGGGDPNKPPFVNPKVKPKAKGRAKGDNKGLHQEDGAQADAA